MADDLGPMVDSIEGEGPSAEFVRTLRERIVAETQGPSIDAGLNAVAADGPPDDLQSPLGEPEDELIVVFGQRPSPIDDGQAKLRLGGLGRQLLAAAAAVVLVLAGVWALTLDDDRDELDTVEIPTTTTEPTDAEGGDELGAPLTAGNTYFDAGTFRIDTLGTDFTFTVEETTGLLVNENDTVLIRDLTSSNADDRTITFRRTSLLPDPNSPTGDFDPRSGWPADDLIGWLELLGDDVTATSPTSATLGGLDALFVELDFPCRGGSCVANRPTEEPELPMFTPGSRYRMWVVDQGPEDPIVVLVAIDDEDEVGWFDEADAILETLEFGEVEPNPVRRVPAGPIELDVFGGISLELPDEAVVVEPFDGFARIFPPGIGADGQQRPGVGWGGDVEFLTRPLDTDGVEVVTIERLVKLLEDEAAVLTELGPFDVGGFEARMFEIDSGGLPNVVLKVRPDDLVRSEFGWESPRIGNFWGIEHPERGLLLVSTETRFGPEPDGELRPWTEALLRSLEFDEP